MTLWIVKSFRVSYRRLVFLALLVLATWNQNVKCFAPRIRRTGTNHHQRHLSIDSPGHSMPTEASSSKKYDVSLLLIDHYDSFTYNLYDMLAQLTVEPPLVVAKDAFDSWDSDKWKDIDGIILSPGPGSPQDQPDFSKQAIQCNTRLPILGVCLGHQLLALEYGATVDKAPIPIHGQDHLIRQQNHKNDFDETKKMGLFHDLPAGFRAVRYHSLAATNLPNELRVTATSSDSVIQGIQHKEYPHYGVQFHPESIGTQYGMGLLENFCKIVLENKKEIKKGKSKQPTTKTKVRDERSMPSRFEVLIHAVEGLNADTIIEPTEIFEAIYASESHSIWLDSSSAQSSGRGTLDIMAAPNSDEDILEYYLGGNETTDILSQLQEELYGGFSAPDSLGLVSNDSDDIQYVQDTNLTWPPFDYRGGYLGFLGYEVRHDTQRFLQQQEYNDNLSSNHLHRSVNSSIPTAAFFLARKSFVYHHPTHTWYLVGLVENGDNEKDEILEWMRKGSALISSLGINKEGRIRSQEGNVQESLQLEETLAVVPNRPKKTYEENIADCHELIRLGESYELCLTNQLEAQTPKALSPWHLYRRLRLRNPAPYSSYVCWNMENPGNETPKKASFAICSSSPERFMSVQRKTDHPCGPPYLQAEAKPIKGTSARVEPQNGVCLTESERREDERRARSLEISLKNRAENLMIVDLLRNDMSRVCKIGSVHVAKLMAIESFATVHQMVSTIRGTLADDTTSIDLLRASFPGGSMTGAPKIRTMELLEDLEQNVDRGPYAGSLGYLSVNGCMDMNIIIRSAVVTPSDDGGRKIAIGAGGAITALSETQDEYDEMLLKARAVVQAVQEWAASPELPLTDTKSIHSQPTKSESCETLTNVTSDNNKR